VEEREESYAGRAWWSSSGLKQVVYKPDQAVRRAWSGNFGDCDDRVDLIGSIILAWPLQFRRMHCICNARLGVVWCQVLIVEAAHTFGLCLLVYKVLPAYDIVRALLLTCATNVVPAALKLLLTKGGRSPLSVIIDICALLMQCSVFFLCTMYTRSPAFQFPDSLHLLELCASVLLISMRYWENFIDRDIGTLSVQNFKQTLRLGRCKMYIFASIWKIALTLAFAYLLIPQVRIMPYHKTVPIQRLFIGYRHMCTSHAMFRLLPVHHVHTVTCVSISRFLTSTRAV